MGYIIKKWHSRIDMPKKDFDWHKADIAEELQEYKEASGLLNRWSEVSDVVYTYTRAIWSGHKNLKYPLSQISFYVGLLYMFPKYTLRWKFYRVLGHKIDKNIKITQVRNPRKLEKLKIIAEKHNINPEQFIAEANKLMKKWIFLK